MSVSLRRAWILSIAAGVGISLSAIATLFVYRWEMSQQQIRFQQQIENLAIALQRSLNRYSDLLTFLDDHYDVRQGQVTRLEFETFVARSLAEYPGIQALEWAPHITLTERETYEQAVQAEGYPTFQITELGPAEQLTRAGDRPSYIPVTYLAPFAGNEAAFGFDLNSSPARVAAIEPARDSGKIHTTGRIRLVQEQRDQYGFLVVLPLYQTATIPASQAARRSQFAGVLLGVFRVSDVVEEALKNLSYNIDFDLRDQNAESAAQFLGRFDAATQTVVAIDGEPIAWTSGQARRLCPTPIRCTRYITIGQRQWLVSFAPAATYALSQPYATGATLLTGLLLTSSLVLFLRNLQNELARTQQLNELKLRFFSMASHELRTPLSTILLSTESLQANFASLSNGQKQSNLERIHLTAQQMSQQITDLLTLTRAEVGKLEFNPQMLDVTSFCQQVIDEIQPGIAQPVEVLIDQPAVKAFWDKKLVRSLLTNLLSNAAKYSADTSSIQLRLQSDADQATLQVSDQGIGIPAVDQTRILETFQRGSNAGHIAGTGLGLAIVHVCVQLHQGHWQIHSKEGQGTTVLVTLPLE
jgi:signal transduction histidine kinase